MAAKYRVLIKKRAEKELDGLPGNTRETVYAVIRSLKENPYPPGCSKLKLIEGWRIRVGDYRVIYLINGKTMEITIIAVKHRKDIYR